jgi:HSP20 family protein
MLVATSAGMQEQVIARVVLPGAINTDVNLQVHQTRLLITAGPEGTAQLLKHLEGDTHVIYRRDRKTGGFFRSVLLPQGVHVDDIKATMTDGVLVVTAPGKEDRDA